MTSKKKLIEVALPLDAINAQSAREKSIRHGHPSTLHLWWARRPLAACRAVLLAQVITDPSEQPDRYPTIEDQTSARARLMGLISEVCDWDRVGSQRYRDAVAELLQDMATDEVPWIVDPFAGGGSIPLEASRLGFPVQANDLNPIPVLINKAMLDIPSRLHGIGPVHPQSDSRLSQADSRQAIASDVRRYGDDIMRSIRTQLSSMYPQVRTDDGRELDPIAWIWTRVVRCPNPACGVHVPLVRSFWLGKKKHRQAWVVPHYVDEQLHFTIGHGDGGPQPEKTITRSGAKCIYCGENFKLAYVKAEAQGGRLEKRLMAVAASDARGRVYVAPDDTQEKAADAAVPAAYPDGRLSTHPQYMGPPRYGLETFSQLFLDRQLCFLTTLAGEIGGCAERVAADALEAGAAVREAEAYGTAIATYLAFTLDRLVNLNNALCQWRPDAGKEHVGHMFARQAIPMVWDFAEANPLGSSAGSWEKSFDYVPKVIERLPASDSPVAVTHGSAAGLKTFHTPMVVSMDPPYYDNVPYSDLSDFFYIWLRSALSDRYPDLLATLLSPKSDELVADHVRLGGKEEARTYFESTFREVVTELRSQHSHEFPMTIFYAFKQEEVTTEGARTSTGWETFLQALIHSGWTVTATWPMRTELRNRQRSIGANALASSVVIACRPRADNAPICDRRALIRELRDVLPGSLRTLQQGGVAPADLPQAAIGPGMAVFSQYTRTVEADGTEMSVRSALQVINQVLDEVLADQEGDLDIETRWALTWFRQFGWTEGPFGEADSLGRARNLAVSGLVAAGIVQSRAGRVRLLKRNEYSSDWSPEDDSRLTAWETLQHLANGLETGGEERASALLSRVPNGVAESARELAYRLYSLCNAERMAGDAVAYNAVVTAWPYLERSLGEAQAQSALFQ